MNPERSKVESNDRNRREEARRREALQVLLDARERLMTQMMDDILERREALDSEGGSYSSFELEEIEDRYTARLQAINSLLENLEYRQPSIRYEVEAFTTSLKVLKKDLAAALDAYDQWDLVSVNVVPGRGEDVTVLLTFTADEYPET
jgi:hypothetical protein